MMGNDVGYLSEGVGGAHHGRMAQRGIGYLTRKKRTALICNIDMNPFVGVMIVLLWLFIGPTQSPHPRGASVELARARNGIPVIRADREDAMTVAVMRDGTTWFRNDKIVADILPAKIQDSIKAGSERTIYIKADARTKYGNVKTVLENVRLAGIERIVFLVDKRRDK